MMAVHTVSRFQRQYAPEHHLLGNSNGRGMMSPCTDCRLLRSIWLANVILDGMYQGKSPTWPTIASGSTHRWQAAISRT